MPWPPPPDQTRPPPPPYASEAWSVISGTDASASRPDSSPGCPRRREGTSARRSRARRLDGERDLRDPRSGNEGHGRIDVERSGGVPACASPCESAIEKHAACAAAMSSSVVVRPAASPVLRVPAHGQRFERAAPDAINRPTSFQQRSRPGDVSGRVGHQFPPFESRFHGDGRARPDERGEQHVVVRRLRLFREHRVVGIRRDDAGGDR